MQTVVRSEIAASHGDSMDMGALGATVKEVIKSVLDTFRRKMENLRSEITSLREENVSLRDRATKAELANGPGHAKLCLMSYANNKGADQPAHPRSLISTFFVRCLDSMICILAIFKVSRF